MTTQVRLGAKQDGTLTAIAIRVVSNTGAYGGHGGETLAAALASPLATYRCPNKKAEGYAVYTNLVPGGGFRGYGASQTTFAIECAIDDLADRLGLDPFEIRRRNMIRPGDWIESVWGDPSDVDFGSYGLDQCMDFVERALASGRGERRPEGEEWEEGTGCALAMLECGPPTEHRSGADMRLLADGSYHLAVGSTEMGNGSVTSHRQIAAEMLTARAGRIAIVNADTDLAPYDTGTFASTGTVVAGKAVALAAAALRDNILEYASRHADVSVAACRLDDDAAICGGRRIALADLHAAGARERHRFETRRKAYLSPRTIAFNVHGVRLAVHRVTGEIRILHSVHGADIGRLINPMQCRGQIDGAIAMGLGWALCENMAHDADGKVVNPALRNYRIPAFADVPPSEVFFADTYDRIGPLGAKSQGECAINPVAPAIANAVFNATGVRFAHLPLTPDRIFAALREPAVNGAAASVTPGVTIVTQTRVREGMAEAFGRWQGMIGAEAAGFAGFIEQSVIPPEPPSQADWVILQRFAHSEDASAWLRSAERTRLLDVAQPMLVGRDDVHLVRGLAGGVRPAPVSAVISSRVRPGQEAAFRAWEQRIAAAQARSEGFQGYRFEPPIAGVQDDWLAILRFDTERNLQAWLDSPERRALLAQAAPFLEEFHARVVRTGFDQWFPAGAAGGPAPAAWKQNMIVLLLLYPVVFLFGAWVQAPLLMRKAGLPFWLALFVGNIVSVLLLNWLVPWASRGFRWWLAPARGAGAWVSVAGAGLIALLYAALLVAFSTWA